jgi:hypothetical protein
MLPVWVLRQVQDVEIVGLLGHGQDVDAHVWIVGFEFTYLIQRQRKCQLL